MPIDISSVRTTNDVGEPVRTFNGGDKVTFQTHFRVSEVPDNTSVRMTFIMHSLSQVRVGDIAYVFTPTIHWQETGRVNNNGSYVAWTTWQVPEEDPFVGFRDWARVWEESWIMLTWPGVWELTGTVSFTEPPRDGEFDHNKERWLMQFRY